jgi:uncharacterized protein (UPF0335 family)
MLGHNEHDPMLQAKMELLDDIGDRRKELNDEAGAVYQELRDAGYNVKAVRRLVAERRMDRDALAAFNATLDDYRGKLGMFAETPLGEATAQREASEARSVEKPTPFAEQTVHEPRRRGRPRNGEAKPMFDA